MQLAQGLFTRAPARRVGALVAAAVAAPALVLTGPPALAAPHHDAGRPTAGAARLASEARLAEARLAVNAKLPHPGRPEVLTHPAADGLDAGLPGRQAPAGAGLAPRAAVAVAPAVALPGPLGVDVSNFQGDVNWARLARAHVRFAMVKATEGTYYKSPAFFSQYSGSYDAGLIRGAYHFAVPNNSTGAAQADFFVAHGGGWSGDGHTLPGMLDIEYNPYGRNECYGLKRPQMVAWVASFDDEYHRLTGRYPLLYTNANWWDACTGGSSVADHDPLDLAAWGGTPGRMPGGWGFETIWQYTDNNAFGYDGDSFNGSAAGLSAIALGHPVASPPPSGPPGGGGAVIDIGSVLGARRVLRAGHELSARGGAYRVVMQRDGNLVEYDRAHRPLWSTGTYRHPGARALMAAGGDLVVLSPANRPLWASGTAGQGPSYAVVQANGNFALYRYAGGGTWTSRTAGRR